MAKTTGLPTLEDLVDVSRGDLLKLRANVEEALRANEAREKQAAKDKIKELVESSGFNLVDLFGDMLPRTTGETGKRSYNRKSKDGEREPVAPKYRHPENPSETWSGRGRKPKWVEAHLEAGGNMEDLLINKQD